MSQQHADAQATANNSNNNKAATAQQVLPSTPTAISQSAPRGGPGTSLTPQTQPSGAAATASHRQHHSHTRKKLTQQQQQQALSASAAAASSSGAQGAAHSGAGDMVVGVGNIGQVTPMTQPPPPALSSAVATGAGGGGGGGGGSRGEGRGGSRGGGGGGSRGEYGVAAPLVVEPPQASSATADCFLCLKAKAPCDHNFPCGRCVSMKVPHMCLSADSINRRLHSSQSSAAKLDPSFILGELSAMKREQRKLYEEVMSLRKQNERLEMALASQSPSLSPASSGSFSCHSPQLLLTELNKSHSSSDHERTPLLRMGRAMVVSNPTPPAPATKGMLLQDQQAIVIFDLSQNPATVLNATERFCQVLGYGVEEVMGMAWHKLIHRDYVDRTMNILQKNMNNTIDIDQLYVHKDGRLFSANDTHRIFLNPEGKPLLDIVSVRLHTTEPHITGLQALPPPIGPPMLEGAESLVSSLSPKTYHAQHSISRGSSRPPARTLAYPYPSVHPLPSQQPAYWPDTGPVMPPQLPYISTPSTNGLTQSDNITNADPCKSTDQHFPTYSSQNPRFSDPGCGGYVPSISTTPYDQTCGAQPNLSPHGNVSTAPLYTTQPMLHMQQPIQQPPQLQMPLPLPQQNLQGNLQPLPEEHLPQLPMQPLATPTPPPPIPFGVQMQQMEVNQHQIPQHQHQQQQHNLAMPFTPGHVDANGVQKGSYTEDELFQLIMDSEAFTVHNIP